MDEKTFNLIFDSRSTRSIHHRVALEAVKFLDENLANIFLKYYEGLLVGSTAPDEIFKDYKNHVLFMPEKWGGAPKAVNDWFNKTVSALKNKRWEKAVFAAGVMSHYIADINHPLHTGQTEEEGLIHSFTEWGAAEIYLDLRKDMIIGPPEQINKIKDYVIKSANEANNSYIFVIENYDLEQGQKSNWGKGYNDALKAKITQRIASAIQGTASLYLKAIAEAGNPDPGKIKLGATRSRIKLTAQAERNRQNQERKMRKKTTKQMKNEFYKTKRVQNSLMPDDRYYLQVLQDGEIKPVNLPKSLKTISAKVEKKAVTKIPLPKFNLPKKSRFSPAITFNSDIEDAAEVSKATADKFKKIGIIKVVDFVVAKPEDIVNLLREKLNYNQLDVADISRMITETKLMLEIWRLHVHDAVILYKVGIRTKADLKKQKQAKLWKAVQIAIKDKHVKKFLRRSNLIPNLEEVSEWIESAKE
ncbi:MAG: DUF4332 domain-containing protein [Candidatus Heimdallarchaeota archaeon]